jgi:hypothetical protein
MSHVHTGSDRGLAGAMMSREALDLPNPARRRTDAGRDAPSQPSLPELESWAAAAPAEEVP